MKLFSIFSSLSRGYGLISPSWLANQIVGIHWILYFSRIYFDIKFLPPHLENIYSPSKVKHHLTCFNNIFSNNELISNWFAVLVTCTHIHVLTYLWNRLLIDFYLCVYDRVCKVPRVLFNICVCERKLIFVCRVLSLIFYWFDDP